ncbi:MAG: M24B family metallopeptidase [Bacteroidales bacterium]
MFNDPSNSLANRILENGPDGRNRGRFTDCRPRLDEMRVTKDPLEVERIQKACNITALALTRVMREVESGRYEFGMEALIEGTFREYGAAMPGFSSIVGSGPGATTLHYEANDREIGEGELLLMDIGAEYGMYTADITRTIPVSGEFSEAQRTIYQLVLDAQLAAIEQMNPGNMFTDGHMAAKEVILSGLEQLGLITDRTSPWQIDFYLIYASSHYLGLDVHDVGDMGGTFASFKRDQVLDSMQSRVLEKGMVLTIEPGLYFRENGLDQLHEIYGAQADSSEIAAFIHAVSPAYDVYKNIGVRIEDDILITADGHIVLSRYAPKQIEDIEMIMR